jgi:PAS domain S-box-containing protein
MSDIDAPSRRAIENLSVLNTLMRLSLSGKPLVEILQQALAVIHQTSWLRILPKGGVFLTNRQQDALDLVASHDLSVELETLCARVRFGCCLCGRAAQSKDIEFASCIDHRHDISFPGMSPHGHYSIPILDECDDLLGVLVLYLPHGHEFDEIEVKFLRTVADTLASVIKRKRAEEDNESLARIVNEAANEIFLVDIETSRFIRANRVACHNLGYSFDELLKLTLLDISSQYTPAKIADMIQPLVQGEREFIHYETKHRRKNGSDYYVSVNVQMMRSGNRTTFAAIAEDITERRRADKKLKTYRNHLEELVMERTQKFEDQAKELAQALGREKEINERQRQFVSMVSHEFRTPLAIIDSSAQRLLRNKEHPSPEDIVRRSAKIRAAVMRMTELMESTLSAARHDSGKIVYAPADGCDLRRLLVDCCNRFQDVTSFHNIVCRLDELPDSIHGDGALLDQVFTNLLSNAIKYSPVNPDIVVTGSSEPDHAIVSVRDFGLGIDETDLPRMFERFFRAQTSTGIAGTGIGLNLVKTLVEQHGGTISVDSRKGEGSCFTVRLPRHLPAAANPQRVAAA